MTSAKTNRDVTNQPNWPIGPDQNTPNQTKVIQTKPKQATKQSKFKSSQTTSEENRPPPPKKKEKETPPPKEKPNNNKAIYNEK